MAQSWVLTPRKRLMLAALDALAWLSTRFRDPDPVLLRNDEVRRILVVELWNIGDVVLAIPFLAQLRARFPSASISLLARNFAGELLAGTGLVDEFIVSDLTWTAAETRTNPLAYRWPELRRIANELRKRKFDLAFKARMHIREHVVLRLSGARRRVAFGFGAGDRVLTDAIRLTDPNGHKAADWLLLLEPFGGAVPLGDTRLCASADERRCADQYLMERGISPNVRVIGFHPGASVPEKRWPLDRFCEVMKSVSRLPNVRALAFVDPEGYGASLADVDGAVTARVGLREMMALIERCEMLVCNDSGPMHIAGALGTPTIAIFGSGINAWFAPLGTGHRFVTSDPEPRAGSVQPYDVANIPVSRVLSEVRAALADHA
jgi:heptosyltransferase-2